ncbi:WD40 repeat domain-containing protein [Streptomyces beigongshangae]|uniref:WD40 repeat domain-containing protein n=1 Tax=Streptomyces beigongshangae TaxID=2841597 RepID=UPI001C858157|nr:WD40 repeat domain-containing protein [Streptomyces sp. REN17]
MRSINLPVRTTGHAAPVTHVAWHRTRPWLATASYDGTAAVWEVTDGAARPTRRLRHRRLVNCTAWNPVRHDVLATASADKTVAVWDLAEDGAGPRRVLARHTDDVNSVAWLPDGERLVCVSQDGSATLWNTADGTLLGTLVSHTAHCMAVDVNADGLVATAGEDGLVCVLAPDGTGTSAGARRRYATSVEGCAWSRSGRLLAVARDDGFVDVLDQDLTVVLSVWVSRAATRSVAWTSDDSMLLVGAYDGHVHFLRALDGTRISRYEDAAVWPRSVAAGTSAVAVGSFGGSPVLLDAADGGRIGATPAATHGINALTVLNGRLALGCDSGLLLEVDLASATSSAPRARATRIGRGPVLSLAASGGDLYAGTYAGDVIVRRPGQTGVLALEAPVTSLIAHDGGAVAGTYGGELVRIGTSGTAVARRPHAHQGSIKALAALDATAFVSAATDHRLAAGGFGRRDDLWRHGNLVNAVATLDAELVATASRDHTVRVGHVEHRSGTWRVRREWTLLGADESVKAVGLLGHADHPTVLAGSYDFTLRAWRPGPYGTGLTDGEIVAEFDQAVSCVCRIDRTTAAVAGWDGRLLLVRAEDGRTRVVGRLDVESLADLAGLADLTDLGDPAGLGDLGEEA